MKPFSIEFEWIDPGSTRIPEFRETYAAFSIVVRGTSVTQLLRTPSHSSQDRLYEPLYPLAEWIVSNWWPLRGEGRTPGRRTTRGWRQRHNLRTASEGYPLPNLELWREGKLLHLAWKRQVSDHARVVFLSDGQARIPADEVEGELVRFVDAVIDRLRSRGVEGTFLEQEWQHLQAASPPDELAFCAAAGALGLDPFDIDADLATKIEDAAAKIPLTAFHDFVRIADASQFAEQCQWMLDGLVRVRESRGQVGGLIDVPARMRPHSGNGRPWKVGYDCAEVLRQQLEFVPASPPIDLDALLNVPNVIDQTLIDSPPSPVGFDGLFGLSATRSPALFLRKRRIDSQRFAFCRALFHFVFAKDDSALLSAADDDRQKSNRAFAAELLAPARLLQAKLSGPIVLPDELDDLAVEFEVSPWVIRHQIKNHRLASLERLE